MKGIPTRLLLIGGAVVLAVIGAGAVVAFGILGSSPPPLTLNSSTPKASATATPTPGDPLAAACGAAPKFAGQTGVTGAWLVQPGGVAGYRAREKWEEITSPHEAVARTQRVAGWATLTQGTGIRLDRACFAVELATLTSEDQVPGRNMADRDENARGFLNTTSHPFAIFRVNGETLLSGPPNGSRAHVTVSGRLEINGVPRPANLSVDVALTAGQLNLVGSTGIVSTDYGLQLPTIGDFVAVDPHITVEFSVSMVQTSS